MRDRKAIKKELGGGGREKGSSLAIRDAREEKI